MTGIETKVEGSTASVDRVASWLRQSLKARVDDASEDVLAAKRLADRSWLGDSGDAYAGYAKDIVSVTDEHVRRIERAAGKFDAYSARLQRIQTRMAELRGDARAGGLTVAGTTVQQPDPAVDPGVLIGEPTPQQADQHAQRVAAYRVQLQKVQLYNRIAGDVEDESTRFVEWVDAHLAPADKALEAPAVEKMIAFLQENAGNLGISYSLTYGERAMQRKAAALAEEATDLRRARRSGNPARRALGNHPDTPGRIRDLRTTATWFGRGGRLLGPLGTGIELWGALESDSPGGGAAAAGLGIAATAAVIATAPVSVPTAAVVAGAVVIGAGVTWGANKVWEDVLPDDFTEPIDDAVGEAWDDTKDFASDAWDEVTGWF